MLRLIKENSTKSYSLGPIQIMVAPMDKIPDAAEIMVFEEDTSMVLTVDREFLYQEEHPIRTFTDIHNSPKRDPGDLVVKGSSWYALVIDLDADTVCKPSWIEAVYEKVFLTLEKKKVTSAAMHLLGSIHAKTSVDLALKILCGKISRCSLSHLKMIYLIVDKPSIKEIHELLAVCQMPGTGFSSETI